MFENAHDLIVHYGYVGLFFLLVLGIVGVPVPDETLVTLSGFLIRKGELPLAPTFLAAVLGSCVGVTLSFIIGRTLGFRVIHKYRHFFHLTEEDLGRFHRWYERTGRWMLTFGYFIPGFRHLTAIASGVSGMRWPEFAVFAYSGALLWVSTFLIAGYFLGAEWQKVTPATHMAIELAIGACVTFGVAYAFIHHIRHRKNRRPPDDSRSK
jgi:membrane protein DedA with SNARE-associated domain